MSCVHGTTLLIWRRWCLNVKIAVARSDNDWCTTHATLYFYQSSCHRTRSSATGIGHAWCHQIVWCWWWGVRRHSGLTHEVVRCCHTMSCSSQDSKKWKALIGVLAASVVSEQTAECSCWSLPMLTSQLCHCMINQAQITLDLFCQRWSLRPGVCDKSWAEKSLQLVRTCYWLVCDLSKTCSKLVRL